MDLWSARSRIATRATVLALQFTAELDLDITICLRCDSLIVRHLLQTCITVEKTISLWMCQKSNNCKAIKLIATSMHDSMLYLRYPDSPLLSARRPSSDASSNCPTVKTFCVTCNILPFSWHPFMHKEWRLCLQIKWYTYLSHMVEPRSKSYLVYSQMPADAKLFDSCEAYAEQRRWEAAGETDS